MHTHRALLLDEKPLVYTVYVKVMITGRDDFDHVVCGVVFLTDDAQILPEC